MRVMITATVQFEADLGEGCTEYQAIHAGRARLVDDLYELEAEITDVHAENLDSEDGSF